MRGNAQNVPERSTYRHMCLRDNLTDRAHCGGLVMRDMDAGDAWRNLCKQNKKLYMKMDGCHKRVALMR